MNKNYAFAAVAVVGAIVAGYYLVSVPGATQNNQNTSLDLPAHPLPGGTTPTPHGGAPLPPAGNFVYYPVDRIKTITSDTQSFNTEGYVIGRTATTITISGTAASSGVDAVAVVSVQDSTPFATGEKYLFSLRVVDTSMELIGYSSSSNPPAETPY